MRLYTIYQYCEVPILYLPHLSSVNSCSVFRHRPGKELVRQKPCLRLRMAPQPEWSILYGSVYPTNVGEKKICHTADLLQQFFAALDRLALPPGPRHLFEIIKNRMLECAGST